MPIVSGAVVSEMNPTSHVGNIRLLRPVVVSIKPKKDNQAKNDHTKDAEEPEEPLGIVTEIAAIIFLVAFTDFLPLISKHGIDLTDMHLHLFGHPLAFFGKQFLNLMGMILRIASSRIVGTEDVEGCSGCFSLNLSDNS